MSRNLTRRSRACFDSLVGSTVSDKCADRGSRVSNEVGTPIAPQAPFVSSTGTIIPHSLYLKSASDHPIVASAAGLYLRDGIVNGFPRFAFDAGGGDVRILYRALSGHWSVATSEVAVAGSKGTIVSAEAAVSPVGLTFRFNSQRGKWPKDPSLTITSAEKPIEAEPDIPEGP